MATKKNTIEKIDVEQVCEWGVWADNNHLYADYDYSKVVIDKRENTISVKCPIDGRIENGMTEYTFKGNSPLSGRRRISNEDLPVPEEKRREWQAYVARDIAIWIFNNRKNC